MKERRYLHPKVAEEIETRREYEKPLLRLIDQMTFPMDGLKTRTKELGTKYVCRQCSSCHGCR